MAALLGVLGSGLLHGVLIGVALSIVLLIRRAVAPARRSRSGASPARRTSPTSTRHPENERVPRRARRAAAKARSSTSTSITCATS